MEIGLYQFKYLFRNFLKGLLPFLREIDPNWISLSIIPTGLITAIVYAYAGEHSWLYLIGMLLILFRMVLGTLDGMAAEEYRKNTPEGVMINRIAPECADILLMVAIAFNHPGHLALWAVAIGWLTSYLGLIGATIGRPVESSGPVGQTDRLIALALCSLLSALLNSPVWIELFLCWCLFGGVATSILRLQKQFEEAGGQGG